MEIGPYDEKRYAQLEALGVGNLKKRLKYLKINEAAERECIDSLERMAMALTKTSYLNFCKENSAMEWIKLLRSYVNQFKHKVTPRNTWAIPDELESRISPNEIDALNDQIQMLISLSFYTFNSSSINSGMSTYTGGGQLDNKGQEVWAAYKKWSQNSNTRTDVPVYRQLTVPNPQNSAWWKYAADMANGVNPNGPVGIIKSSRYLSCSFHKGFIEGACFPVYKNTEGVINFIIKNARGINISAFSGYNSTNQRNALDTVVVMRLNMENDSDVTGVASFKKKHVDDVMHKGKSLWGKKRRIKRMKKGCTNMENLLRYQEVPSTVAAQAEFLLAPGSKLMVDRIIQKPALPGAANVPVLNVYLTYMSSTIKTNGLPELLTPTEQSMFVGPKTLYP
jgi:hypothetical protein